MRRAAMVGLLCVLACAAVGCASARRFSGVILGVGDGDANRLIAIRPDGSVRVVYEEIDAAAPVQSGITGGVYDWLRDRYYIALGARGELIAFAPATYEQKVIYRPPSEEGAAPTIYGLDIAPDCSYVLFVVDGVGVFRWRPGDPDAVKLCDADERWTRVRAVGPEIAYLLVDGELSRLNPNTGEARPIYESPAPLLDVDPTGGWLLQSGGAADTLMVVKLSTFGVGSAEPVAGFTSEGEPKTARNAWSSPSPIFADEGTLVCHRSGWLWGAFSAGTYIFDMRAGGLARLTGMHLRALWHGPVTPP
jgi:hypothetical protein